LTGQFTVNGGTMNVAINGAQFATITTVGAEVVITGAAGEPLAQDELEVLERVFDFAGSGFLAFDQLLAPVGTLVSGA
jgi:hypothetical protein